MNSIQYLFVPDKAQIRYVHGLRTPNEGINQRYLKNWADVVDKICFGIWEWEWIFGRTVKAISSPGVRGTTGTYNRNGNGVMKMNSMIH